MPWALRGSLGALRALFSAGRFETVFFHTQTIALLAPLAARRRPYVVSLDATPVQVDEMGRWYDHAQGNRLSETLKRWWYRLVLARAAAVVTWSDWALDSVRSDYGVEPKRSLVAHPGAGPAFFGIERRGERDELPVILFVGGQFERKGGHHLLEAFATVSDRARLLLVTEDDVPEPPGVTVRRGIRPNTPELLAAFEEADIFCLPTMGDCTPVAIGEAMAAGLPVVTTEVGSNLETVPEGTGLLVEAGESGGLAAALAELVGDAERRRAMGAQARAHATEHMDAGRNASRILELLDSVAS